MTWGIGVFNQGVFLAYYVQEYGWLRSTLSIGPTLFHLWAGIMGVFVGRLIDRRGPRPVLYLGAVTMAAATITFGLTRSPWHTYPAFFLLGTSFACLLLRHPTRLSPWAACVWPHGHCHGHVSAGV
jgi:MFS family permease